MLKIKKDESDYLVSKLYPFRDEMKNADKRFAGIFHFLIKPEVLTLSIFL